MKKIFLLTCLILVNSVFANCGKCKIPEKQLQTSGKMIVSGALGYAGTLISASTLVSLSNRLNKSKIFDKAVDRTLGASKILAVLGIIGAIDALLLDGVSGHVAKHAIHRLSAQRNPSSEKGKEEIPQLAMNSVLNE